jgi:hypothetical protein
MPEGKILVPDESANPEQPIRPDQIAQADFSQSEYKRFYANHVTTTMSLFEVRLILNSVQGIDPKTEKLVVDETLNVRMAPELAFALMRSLQQTLRQYITTFGPMRPLPPSLASAALTDREALKVEPSADPSDPPQPGS